MPLVIPLAYWAIGGLIVATGATIAWQQSGGPEATADALNNLANAMTGANDEAEESSGTEATTDACSTCEPPEEDPDDGDPTEQDAKDAKRMKPKELEKAARNNGYRNAHKMKEDLGLDSKSDIFVDRQGRMYSGGTRGHSRIPEYLHMNAKGAGM